MARTLGAMDKRRKGLEAIIRREFPNFNAIRELVLLSQTTDDENVKLSALKEIAPYFYPKLKSVEHTGNAHQQGPLVIHVVPHTDRFPAATQGQVIESETQPALEVVKEDAA